MSGFLIVGIVVNVLLTGLAIYWVVRNMKSGSPHRDKEKGGDKD